MIYACFPNAVTDDKCFVDSNWLVNMDNKLYCSPLAITNDRVEAIIDDDTDKVIGSRVGSGRPYKTPVARRNGQLQISHVTRLLILGFIYDTSSGALIQSAVNCVTNFFVLLLIQSRDCEPFVYQGF